MGVYKDGDNKWRAVYRYTDWTGQRKQTQKRGFKTKREAKEWEAEQLNKVKGNVDMTFKSFVEIYKTDQDARINENTWGTKECIIEKKLVPYFGDKRMCDIQPKDIIKWQNVMLNHKNKNGEPFSPVYLKTIHNQLSAIFNHAVKFYGLPSNPAAMVGNMGKSTNKEKPFWTKEEYLKFIDAIMDKPLSFYAFETLYWTGIRLGELLALTPADFDFEKKTLSITKSYQRIHGRDVITPPKTDTSIRTINISDFLCEEIQEYIKSLYKIEPDDRMFTVTKSYLHHEMDRGTQISGVKRIPIHALRHSHVSLLFSLGYSVVDIAKRTGHKSIYITLNYAHMFPTVQTEMADKLDVERGEY